MNFLKNIFRTKEVKRVLFEEDAAVTISDPVEVAKEESTSNSVEPEIAIAEVPEVIKFQDLPPFEPFQELKGYRFPSIDCFQSELASSIIDFSNKKREALLPLIWGSQNKEIVCKDLYERNNLFICGSSQTGKTNFINQLVISLLISKHPAEMKIVLAGVQPLEFINYKWIEKHFFAKLPDNDVVIDNASTLIKTLNAICIELEKRFRLLKEATARNISDYNTKFCARKLNPEKGHQYLPSIVIVIDDLHGFAMYEPDLKSPIDLILATGYKAGVYMILTSGPFNGHSLSHSIFQAINQKVVFNLSNKDDYRKFFGTNKTEKYLQQGEFLYNDGAQIYKAKTLVLKNEEIDSVIDFISKQAAYPQAFMLPEYFFEDEKREFDILDKDPLFEDAARLIVQNQIGSTSLLQRRMKLGYNRAGRLMDQLEAAGVVGPNKGDKAREVLIKNEQELLEYLETLNG